MLFDGIKLAEGSEFQNLVVQAGGAFPPQPDSGELFYRTDEANEGLYVYNANAWRKILKEGDSAIAILPDVGTAGTYRSVTVDTKGRVTAGSNPTTLAGYGITDGQPAGFRNKIINGNFGINQRAVTGTVTLAAGVYGHDRFKAGASGCTYTFSSSQGINTLNITAGSLQQVIEDVNVPLGVNTCVLSWAGTAKGKIAGGAYSNSGVTASVIGGAHLTVEFNIGTLSRVQFEVGSVATPFEHRPVSTEIILCRRYYYRAIPPGGGLGQAYSTAIGDANGPSMSFNEMRVSPECVIAGTPTYDNCTSFDVIRASNGFMHRLSVTNTGAYRVYDAIYLLSAEL